MTCLFHYLYIPLRYECSTKITTPMKKFFKLVALCAITSLYSCTGPDKPEPTQNDSKLTPTEHQAKLEQIAIDLIDQINPDDFEELAYSLVTLSGRIPDENFEEEEYYPEEYARSIKNFDMNNIIALTTRATEEFIFDINDPDFDFGGYYFEITEDGEILEGELDDTRAMAIKWDNDALTITWGENKGEYTVENSEEGVTYVVKIPAFIKVAITLSGTEHFSANIEPNITDNYTYAPTITINLNGGYEIFSKYSANNKGVSTESSLKKNGKKLLGGAAAVEINGITNPENWLEEYYDELSEQTLTQINGEYIVENISDGMIQFDVLTLSIVGTGDLKRLINEADALEDRYMGLEYNKAYYDECCAIINKHLKISAIYNDTQERIADIIVQAEPYEDTDETGETYTYYEPILILVFPDGSKFAFDEFFTPDSFANLIDRLGEIAGNME